MDVSLWLPTFTYGEPDFQGLSRRAQRAEQLGFSGLVLLDHLLPIAGVHTSAWLDTVVGLSVLAGVTERVRLGTASMIVGFRHPVMLAKQLASIAMIAGPRVFLGASSGWYAPEYEALGYSIHERGERTDETLEAVRRLLMEDRVTFEGRYWHFEDVTIVPRPDFQIPFLIGGGSRTPDAGSEHDLPTMSETVLRRIVRWEGWIAPCAGNKDLTYRDLETVRNARASAASEASYRLTHVQWIHIADSEDRDTARKEQLSAFRAMMGAHHADEHFANTYLLGTIDEIQGQVERIRDRGFEELILGPVTHDPRQVELIAQHVIPVAHIRGG